MSTELLSFRSVLTCLKFLNKAECEDFPCMLSRTIVFARDLELPGFPTTNNGILSSMQITIMKTFSPRAVFLAMLSSR